MYVHEMQIRVLYAHTDKAGVVYYAKYLEFFESARTEFLRSLGKSYADFEREDVLLTVSEVGCKYLGPAHYDDLLTIRTWIARCRRTRIDFHYELMSPSGERICEAETVMACLDMASRRPRELPQELARLVRESTDERK